jgi:hypothetical protein
MEQMQVKSDVCALRDFLGKAETQHVVPPFQRGFAWESQQVEELWTDLQESEGESYFLGSVVVNTEEAERPQIIDGQQRLAMLTVLLCAIRDKYWEVGEEGRARALQSNYIENTGIPAESYYKLRLSDADDQFFRQYVLQYPCEEKPGRAEYRKNARTLPPSNRRIWRTYEYLSSEVGERISEFSQTGDRLAQLDALQKRLVQSLTFIRITVGSGGQAFTVFETLNDRGLSLSAADLLKNHLFAKAAVAYTDESVLTQLSHRWDGILETLRDAEVTTFLRHYWLSKFRVVRTDELFDEFRRLLKGRDPLSFVEELSEYADHYAVFLNPEQEPDLGVRAVLEGLRTLRATQCYCLLLSARRVVDAETFLRFARLAEVTTVRHSTICDRSARDLERVYHEAAKKLFDARGQNAEEAIANVRSIMPGDDEFRAAFLEKTAQRIREPAKYLLRRIEEHLGTGEKRPVEGKQVHLEHVMPQTLSDAWREALGAGVDQYNEYVNRLGNLTLLGHKLNVACSNRPFLEKRDEYYCCSEFKITQELRACTNWGIAEIDRRQQWLADLAYEVWNPARI